MKQLTPQKKRKNKPLVLTIAGSDPSGGAGIQGDIKTIEANGAFALSVLTAVTAQNSIKMFKTFDLPLWIIDEQLKSLFQDFNISTIKTGMLSSLEIVNHLSAFFNELPVTHFVLDPVMMSKDGSPLLRPDAIETLKSKLIPLATVLTPNIPEAEQLIHKKINSVSEAEEAARLILNLGCQAVLIKGGHLPEAPGCDVLFDGKKITHFNSEFINTKNTHGTGCTYASAIATHLAKGKSLQQSVQAAKSYVTEAIRHSLHIGQGHGPTNHFYFLDTE